MAAHRRRPRHARRRGATVRTIVTGLSLTVALASLTVVISAVGTSSRVDAAADPVLVAAGDIACDPNDTDYNNGNGLNNQCQEKATANEVGSIAPQYLLPMGDTQYDNTASQGTQPPTSYYTSSYDATWGALASTKGGPVPNQNIHPIPGNHEYGDVNDTDAPPLSTGSNYFSNFGPSGLNELPSGVTGASNDWYSFNIPVDGGTWHVVSLDSECGAVGGCTSGSPEETFFKNDLAANAGVCTIVQWHEPRWSVGPLGNGSDSTTFWNDAVAAHVVAVLGGHDHDYEHFGPMDANGNPVTGGTSEFIVGTGGRSLDTLSATSSALVASDTNDYGVLKLTLHSTGASYAFQTVGGSTPDSGTLPCSNTNATTTTVTSVSPSLGITAGGTSVTITGTNFTGATAVSFGSVAATSFTVNSATSITATSPAQSAGTVDVTVTAPAGISAKSGADQFTYGAVTDLAWTQKSPATVPAARAVYGMSVDHNGDVLMLGGDAGHASAIGSFWKYTEPGGIPTWTQLTPAHTPWGLVGASGLADAQMRLDPVSGNDIAFGGTAYSGNFNSTWSWNGTDWSLLSPAHVPSQRSEYGMDFDPSTGHIMMMGGFPNGTFSNMLSDTWIWSGTDWTQQSPVHSPGPRAAQIMVRDPSRGIVVLFGGHNGSSSNAYATVLGDTWTWNGTDWTQKNPVHSPAPRDYAQAYYDPNLQMVVMCGGGNNSEAFNDCWGWNGNDWVKIPQDSLSEISNGATILYSPKVGHAVAFGGWPSFGATPGKETWALATQVPSSGLNPVQYSNAEMVGASPQSLEFNLAPVDAGNFLTAVVAIHKPSGATATITPPPGWTTVATGGTGGSPWVGVYTNANPTPGATSVTFACTISSGSVIAGGVVKEFRGASISGAGDGAVVVGSGGTGQSATATGGTPSASGELALAAFATDSTSTGSGLTTSTTPSGWALAGDQADSLNTDGIAAWAYWKTGSASAPTASLSWTNTGGNVPYTTAITSLAKAPSTVPTVTGVSPISGTTTGATSVSVTGTNFTGATTVKFGSTKAVNFTVNSATSITAAAPSEPAGTVDVTVTTSSGTSVTSSADKFSFEPNEVLPSGASLSVGSSVRSSTGSYRLTLQGDGNLVEYNATNTPVWAAGTSTGTSAVMQGDGNLVVYNATNAPLWASNTSGHPGAYLALTDAGLLSVDAPTGQPLWAGPGLLVAGASLGAGQSLSSPGGSYRLTMQGDGNLVEYNATNTPVWAAGTSAGTSAVMQGDGNLVVYNASNTPLWASNTSEHPGAYLALTDAGLLAVEAFASVVLTLHGGS